MTVSVAEWTGMAQTEPQPEWTPTRTLRIAHASGMVSTQAACSMEAAIVLLEQRADLIGCSLDDVANAVIDRRVDFNP